MQKSGNKSVKVVVIAIILVLLAASAYFLFNATASSEKERQSSLSYAATKKYSLLTDDSSDDEINLALNDIISAENSFDKDSYYYSLLNYYKANLYKRLKSIDDENKALENIISNAKNENYILPLAFYRLASNIDNSGDDVKSLELYENFYNKFGTSTPYSQSVLFSMFRINYTIGNTQRAKEICEILDSNYPNNSLVEFAKSLI